jgi:hypothetical protein
MVETKKPGDLLAAGETLLTIVLSDDTLALKDVLVWQWCLDLITSEPSILLLSQTFVLHTSRVIVSADDGVRDVP